MSAIPGKTICEGTLPRRSFLRSGLVGISSLSLAELLRHEARAAAESAKNEKSIITVWLWGGPSHMETFDMKPQAPSEFRGEFRPVPTNVAGLEISEHLPRLANLGDKFAILRSLHHDSPGHVNSTHTLTTGRPGELVETPPYHPKYPDFASVVHKTVGARRADMPVHVAMPNLRYGGSAYLGGGLEPMNLRADPGAPKFKVPGVAIQEDARPHLPDRLDLLKRFDGFRRELDAGGIATSLDAFQSKALSILTSDRARAAFDVSQEHPRVRDRYGRDLVGQRCLLARRLVEAGARLVTVDFPHVPGQKAFSWDDHASVWNIFEQMKIRLPVLDRVVSALIEDLNERGLANDVLVLVMGEMSHTPRINYFKGNPGREHWGRSMSVFLSGGGLVMGQAIGSTNRTGEEPKDRPLSPGDLLATLYRYLGVPLDAQFRDHFGRPIPLLDEGRPIEELFGRV